MDFLKGKLYAWAETGTEGFIWVLEEEGFTSYAAIRTVEEGDFLEIYDKDGENIVWSGEIVIDRKTNYRPYPKNPEFGQQEVLGCWVHWLPAGEDDLETWAKYFFDEHPATLVKKVE